jgi:hypothetical protein
MELVRPWAMERVIGIGYPVRADMFLFCRLPNGLSGDYTF